MLSSFGVLSSFIVQLVNAGYVRFRRYHHWREEAVQSNHNQQSTRNPSHGCHFEAVKQVTVTVSNAFLLSSFDRLGRHPKPSVRVSIRHPHSTKKSRNIYWEFQRAPGEHARRGKLLLKGGVSLKSGVSKKKHKKAKHVAEGEQQQQEVDKTQVPKADPLAINVMTGKTYEQEFDLEQERMAKPKVKTTPWGSSYQKAPEILHGYSHKIKGETPSERLDMRAATKADKFCK